MATEEIWGEFPSGEPTARDFAVTVSLRQRSEASGMLHSLEDTAREGTRETPARAAVSGKTENRLDEVRTYSVDEPYMVGVNGVVALTETHAEYVLDEITYLTDLRTGETDYYIGVSDLNAGNSILMDVVKRESEPFVGKAATVDRVDIRRSEFPVFQNMYRLANIDTIDDLNNYF